VSFAVPTVDADRVRDRLASRPDVTSVGVAHRRWFTAEPDDPRFPEQRTYLSAMGLPAAWDRGATGQPSVRIAIVDSGVDLRHPDLAGKVVGTYNAVVGGADVRDVVGHGTGTASVAAARTNDGVGIAGAGRDTSLLAVKVADVTGRIFTDDLAKGIVWAVDHGAGVVNLSLGGPTSDRLEKAAVDYAQSHGVLVVAAAGNEGTSVKQFPGALPGVVAVGATSAAGSVRAPFSSYGPWVDVAAPGRSIVVASAGGGYETADGTSYSSPLVSGSAALLLAARPDSTPAELAQALVGGSDSARLGFAHGLVHIDRSLDLLAPGSAPSVTAPSGGSVVSGPLTVSATSAAPRVQLSLADQSTTVTTRDGVASATFETYGLGGAQQVTAADCSAADQCNAPSTIPVTVDNGAPAITAPAVGQEVREDAVPVTANAPGGAVRFSLDSERGVIDSTAPFAAALSTERSADGGHTVKAVLCRSDGTVCDSGHVASVTVQVSRLHPGITALSPAAISPDGDGRRDATRVTYRLDRREQAALVVRDPAGQEVYRRSLGTLAAGTHTATWEGVLTSGRVAPDADYAVQIATTDGTLQGLASSRVSVDRHSPSLTGVHVSSPRVLPVRDDYLDKVEVGARIGETVSSLRLEVSNRSGVVRTIRAGRRSGPAQTAMTWDGRTAGHRLAPGTYRVRLVAEDLAGNRTASVRRAVTVSGQRLVKRSGSITVSARESLEDTFQDDCSEVFRRTTGRHAGWVSYASSATCTSGDAYAAGDHQARLPAAVRYGTVRVSAYGGRGDERYRDSARVVYYDSLQNLSTHAFRLGPNVGNHKGLRAQATALLIRSRVLRWMTLTTAVAWYDVRSYRVDFTYFVLR
jgi:flagellar hook assembly protein FlgD